MADQAASSPPQAVGTCIRQFWSQFGAKDSAPKSLTCRNGGSRRATDMVLNELPAPTMAVRVDAGLEDAVSQID
jgi:hypothetical protein